VHELPSIAYRQGSGQAAARQIEVCAGCHQAEHADLDPASRHPLREGKMAVHILPPPHRSTAPAQLVRNTVNETCTSCHAEYRGPFLWEHQPVAEDWHQLHNPPVPVQPALLKLRPPFLCQTATGRGPPIRWSIRRKGLAGRRRPERFLLAGGCIQLSIADSTARTIRRPRVHAVGDSMKLNRSNWLVPGLIAAFSFVGRVGDDLERGHGRLKCTQCPFAPGLFGRRGARAAQAPAARTRPSGAIRASITAVHTPMPPPPGSIATNDGSYANYELDRLGLASRDGYVEADAKGRYEPASELRRQPNILYDTGATHVPGECSPWDAAGWVSAGGTAGMGLLGTSLAPVTIESETPHVALLGRYFASPSWTVFGEFAARARWQRTHRRKLPDRGGATGAAIRSTSRTLWRPGVAWAGRKASVRVSYLGSWFDDDYSSAYFRKPLPADRPRLSTSDSSRTPPATRCSSSPPPQCAAAVAHHSDLHRLDRHAQAKMPLPAR